MFSGWFAVSNCMVMFICFQPLSHCQNTAIMGLVCHLLAGEGLGNLQTYYPQFCGNQTFHRSHRPFSWDPAEHLHFVNPCNFRALDKFKRGWLSTAANIWNGLPADLILQGEASGQHTILKDVQHCVCTWFVTYVLCMRFITVKNSTIRRFRILLFISFLHRALLLAV